MSPRRGERPASAAAVPRRGAPAAALWIALVLALLTAAVYAPVRQHAFLSYDDVDYVVDNPHVTAGLSLDGVLWAFTSVHQATWHPLTTLSHMLDCQLFGLDPGPHHLGNVVLHVLNTLLLFGVFVRMTAQPWRSACVAALFALHPLHVESVAWVSERKDVLSTCFWMLTLWSYVAYVRRPGWRRYAVVVVAYLAALLSKPMVVTLPFVLLLLDLWPLGRVQGFGSGSKGVEGSRVRGRGFKGSRVQGFKGSRDDELTPGRLEPRAPVADALTPRTLEPSNPRTLVIEKLPLLFLATAVSIITFIVQSRAAAVVPLADSPFGDRVANAVVAYAGYLKQMLWPAGLAVFYPFQAPLPGWKIAGAAMLLVGISAAVWWGARRRPYLLVGWLWYLGMLVPVIGLVRIGDLAMADRYTYMPLIGIFIIAAWGIPDVLAGFTFGPAVCAVLGAAALATCSALTAWQLQFWRDSLHLFQHAVEVMPDNYVFLVNLGMALAEKGEGDRGFAYVAEAVRVQPNYPVAQYAFGILAEQRGDAAAAREHFLMALRLYPGYTHAHIALARTLAAAGDLDGAAAHYREALRLNPDLPDVQDNLGMALDSLGQHDAAMAAFREAVRLAPQNAGAQFNLGQALGIAGNFPEAALHFRAAVQADPHFVQARFGLALAYAKEGQVREAVAEFDSLLREQPDVPSVETMLAWLLAASEDPGLRDGPRATRLAEDAVQRTNRQDPDALNSLAAAYAEVGRFADAVPTAEAAIDVARAQGRTSLASALADRLVRYRAGQPARDLLRGTQP